MSQPENVECPVVDENGNHPDEHDGAECWHCGTTSEKQGEWTGDQRVIAHLREHGVLDEAERLMDAPTPENVETL